MLILKRRRTKPENMDRKDFNWRREHGFDNINPEPVQQIKKKRRPFKKSRPTISEQIDRINFGY